MIRWFIAFLLLSAWGMVAAPLPLVEKGRSSYSILLAPEASPALREAARELQECIRLATGVELPIVEEAEGRAVISLGITSRFSQAGITLEGVGEEGFLIRTLGADLFIAGRDTPVGETTATGGVSNGSANGVYHFLEEALGVAWLMPGEMGRDVPQRRAWHLPPIEIRETPLFVYRRLPYTQDTPAVRRWQQRQKLGAAFHLEMGHNWIETVTPDLYNQHPEWFPLREGRREPPRGHYKLEVTAPGLVDFFAARAVETLQKYPARHTFSLSPSDYPGGWSESAESRALMETLPDGKVSVTPLILDFYRKVSAKVAAQWPQGKLAGYLYSDFLFPPQGQSESLPENFYPVIAPHINYSYKLFHAGTRERFSQLLKGWSALSDQLFYYDLPNIFPHARGAFLSPPGIEIMSYLFPKLAEAGVKGAYIYGTPDWGAGAMTNYLLVKLLWNPHLDVKATQREWLHRAYGAEAGEAVAGLQEKLDRWFAAALESGAFLEEEVVVDDVFEYFNQSRIDRLYATHLAEMERDLAGAAKAGMTAAQRYRFSMLVNNVAVLRWRLEGEGLIAKGPASREEEEIFQLIFEEDEAFDRFPTLADRGPMPPAVEIKLGEPLPDAEARTVRVRHRNLIALYPLREGLLTITPVIAASGGQLLAYCLKDAGNRVVKAGALRQGEAISFETSEPLFLYIPRHPPSYFELEFDGLAAAYSTDFYYKRLNLLFKPTAFYVQTTEPEWEMSIQTVAPKHTARVTVIDPEGKLAGSLETGAEESVRGRFRGKVGFWRVEVDKGEVGTLNDLFLSLGKGAVKWISLDGHHPLIFSAKEERQP